MIEREKNRPAPTSNNNSSRKKPRQTIQSSVADSNLIEGLDDSDDEENIKGNAPRQSDDKESDSESKNEQKPLLV
jgi:hypothetical protein